MNDEGRRVRRTRRGDYELNLSDVERDLLRSLPGQVRELLEADDPSIYRLFPTAYPDDPERDAEYDALVRDDLLARHVRALDTMEATVDEKRLDEEQVLEWLGALNELRLVLGTRLDVPEDFVFADVAEDDPHAPAYAVYNYLSWLQEQVIEALS